MASVIESPSVRLIGVAGCTNGGKTTLSRILKEMMTSNGEKRVTVVSQDDFFRPLEDVLTVQKAAEPLEFFYDYDSPQSIDDVQFLAAIEKAKSGFDYVIVEGNMISEFPEVFGMLDRVLFISLSREVCRMRREKRTDYVPADMPGYFEQIVWPAYEEHYRHTVEMANEDPRITFLDGTAEPPSAEWLQRMLLNFPENLIRIQSEPIKTEEAVEFVSSSSCGATSVFIGTTRNTFHGKRVVKLSYECYEPMAYQELQKLCANIRERFPTIERIAMIHRIDEVPVGEASVIIATSSPHRKEAIEAVDVGINELKRTVPIWKKEIYGDGTSSWKKNAESRTDGSGDLVQNGSCCCTK
ncbi:hypothetical protein L596_007370 [Steinernema carpocapsae]|uniref:Molybdopterin synthase catalytic subunit n=1 Tax=Steinernema carpocapsae TaxID=34508 RepID=A0A4U5P9R9_STECR|nr:hypothetical protein L596_007370 [Steinernema carpocapsae]